MLCGQALDAQSPKKQHQQIAIFIISLTFNLPKTLQRVINEYMLDLIEIWRPRNNKACIQTLRHFLSVVCLIIIKERKIL